LKETEPAPRPPLSKIVSIDVNLTKQGSLPFDLWGLIYAGWKPTPSEGVTVFLQGFNKLFTKTK
jgi:hypothetical protein